MANMNSHQLVSCAKNEGHPASLEKRKIYESTPDTEAAKNNQIRVIDESGEIPATLPKNVEAAVIKAA